MRQPVTRRAALAAALLAIGAIPPVAYGSHADPQIILGKMLYIKDPAPGVDPTQRLVKVRGYQKSPGDADHVTGCGDPTVDGATIRVVADGTSPSDATYVMPSTGWSRIPADVALSLQGFKYKNAALTGGPSAVKTASIRRTALGTFRLYVLLKGANGAIPNVPPNPGTSGGGVFTIGGGGCTYCISLGGAAGGQVSNRPTTPPQNTGFKIVATYTTPTVEAGCPVQLPPSACCGAERITLSSSAGTLQVDNLPPFPFPSGVTTVMDTTAATVGLPTCEHDVHVPSFFAPSFGIPALNFCSQVVATGCEAGTGVGKGKLWDGAGSTAANDRVSKEGDTSDGACDTTYNGSNCTTGGVGSNTLGQIITTRSAQSTTGVRSAIDVPVHSITWADSACSPATTLGCCTGSNYNPAEGDLVITEFDFILSPTTGSAIGAFVDLNADTCKRAGAGFDNAAPGADGPKSLQGTPASGPCCQVGQSNTVVSVGIAFSGGAPLYDLGFKSTIPNTVSACAAPAGGSCTLTTDTCLGSASGAFLE